MTVYLIRHGQTQGNLERRYIGSTDEPLCPQGREALRGSHMPAVDRVFISPMRRCRETAAICFPDMEQEIIPDLRETDFGAFEGRTYEELKDDPAYRNWLDSSGEVPPPGGESKAQVRRRVAGAFRSIVERCGPEDRIALVVHGGTIMTLLEALEPSHQFYAWQSPNGGGWSCRWEGDALVDVEKLA